MIPISMKHDDSIMFHEMMITHTATHCKTHCNTLQHTATHCNTLQHTASHCITLQHTASHCNTLQHTARFHHVSWNDNISQNARMNESCLRDIMQSTQPANNKSGLQSIWHHSLPQTHSSSHTLFRRECL